MPAFRLILVADQEPLAEQFRKHFAALPDVEVRCQRFETVPEFDCMVSPANSFGLMDGGIDAAITRFFGDHLPARVQQEILDRFLGEQPVGTSLIVPTGDPAHPYLAHTPTMRVPMTIACTDTVYLAMWAALLALRQHNRENPRPIRHLLCPGLGTGVGEMPYPEAARQMATAYRHFCHPPTTLDWRVADTRQKAIARGGDHGLLIARARLHRLRR